MKFIAKILFISFVCCGLQIFVPSFWWIVAPLCFVVGLFFGAGGFSNFLAGFFGVAFLWFTYSFYIDQTTGSVLTNKMAMMFSLPSAMLMLLLTAAVGGLVGGMSAWTGYLLRRVFM